MDIYVIMELNILHLFKYKIDGKMVNEKENMNKNSDLYNITRKIIQKQ